MFNLKPIALVIGTVICAAGFFLLIPLITEVVYKTESWQSYAVPILLYIIVGGSLVIINKNVDLKISLKEAFIITILSWLLMIILCAVPFIYTKVNMSVVDALFESMSGVTTTGATVMNNLNTIPKGILIWRAFLQWLGGVGIVVIALFILPFLRIGGMQIFHLEGDDPYDKSLPKISSIIKRIFIIYISLTVILIFLYYIFGMMFFDAIAHSFTTISTGGFSTHDSSFANYDNIILIIAIIFMIFGSLPFLVIMQTSLKNPFVILKDHQVKVFIMILSVATILIFYFAYNFLNGDYVSKFLIVAFNTISIISGTGYVSENFENWGNYASVLFLILMFIGGCAGSTTGGLKIFRFQILFKYIFIHLKKILKPHAILASYFNGKKVNESTYESVMIFFFLYILTFFVSALFLSFSGLDFITCISSSASAISNVGPGLGEVVGPDSNYSNLTDYSKIILIITMFLGRLEMLTIFILFIPTFWRD